MADVQIVVTETGVGIITLTREKALHSLSSGMVHVIYETLQQWKNDRSVRVIIIEGSGEKAFCAGGDIKEIYHNGSSNEGMAKSKAFLNTEYDMDRLISEYSKPIIALMDGIVMGGGVGLSYGATYRVVTEATKWAMPETAISFFPDIGAGYFLNQSPGHIGMYLGLTGKVIKAEDAIYIGAADFYVPSSSVKRLRDDVLKRDWSKENNVEQQVLASLALYSEAPARSELAESSSFIEKHFSHQSLTEILKSLRGDRFQQAQDLYQTLSERSPVSLLVTFAHLLHSETFTSFSEALEFDKQVAARFMECPDFYEGVRCLLIDKGAHPTFEFQDVDEVPTEYVRSFIEN